MEHKQQNIKACHVSQFQISDTLRDALEVCVTYHSHYYWKLKQLIWDMEYVS